MTELLSPAGGREALVAAVQNGADAVYMGFGSFNARRSARNFSDEEFLEAIVYCHVRGVKVHLTLNTLVTDRELPALAETARRASEYGVDAILVQDWGVYETLRAVIPDVPLHASTQMALHTLSGVEEAARLGMTRAVLARELSGEEIREIAERAPIEIETFAHGALCMCYSGMCEMSAVIGGRSGNRGACSQPCRLTYDLTDGSGRTYLAGKHLLSVRDLNLSAHVGELLDAGVRSLKIEGRLKDINYIRNTVAYYRRAVDDALAVRPHLRRASAGESVADFTPDTVKSFTRGESEYFFAGKRAGVASFDTPKAVGEYAGRVTRVERTRFRLDRAHTLAAGDGICFLTPRGLVGTNVNAADGDCVTPNRMEGIAPGCEVYRNYDHRFNQLLERSRTRRVIPAAVVVTESAEGVTFRYTDCEGVAAVAERRVALEPANNAEANAAALRTQAMKSGDTIFAVRSAEVQGAEWFVPASLASQLRREGLAALLQARLARGVEHRILPEGAAEYPSETLSAEENVTNRLAEAFYRDHGVRQIERGLDLAATTAGRRVMRSAYCIRREIGECLKERPRLKGDLWLERGANRYRLEFDCVRCEMSLVDCTRKETAKPKP